MRAKQTKNVQILEEREKRRERLGGKSPKREGVRWFRGVLESVCLNCPFYDITYAWLVRFYLLGLQFGNHGTKSYGSTSKKFEPKQSLRLEYAGILNTRPNKRGHLAHSITQHIQYKRLLFRMYLHKMKNSSSTPAQKLRM